MYCNIFHRTALTQKENCKQETSCAIYHSMLIAIQWDAFTEQPWDINTKSKIYGTLYSIYSAAQINVNILQMYTAADLFTAILSDFILRYM